MAKASEVFLGPDPDAQVREVKNWLKTKGVRDFEPVSLFCDQLTKVSTYGNIDISLIHPFSRTPSLKSNH